MGWGPWSSDATTTVNTSTYLDSFNTNITRTSLFEIGGVSIGIGKDAPTDAAPATSALPAWLNAGIILPVLIAVLIGGIVFLAGRKRGST